MNKDLEREIKYYTEYVNNMKKTIKELEDTVDKQTETIRELKSSMFLLPTGIPPQSKIRGL